ncbi:MAG: hypothetical protein AAGB22_09850, partial [Bacteroidota bacterium]
QEVAAGSGVLFPAQPVAAEAPGALAAFSGNRQVYTYHDAANGIHYQFHAAALPEGVRTSEPVIYFRSMLEKKAENAGWREVQRSTPAGPGTTLDDVVYYTGDLHYVRHRIVYAGNTAYQLSVGGPRKSMYADAASRFLNSFTPSTP